MFGERFPISVNKISSLSLIVIFVTINFSFPHPVHVYFQKSKCLQSSISRSLVLSSDIKKQEEVLELVQDDVQEHAQRLA
jgi:hypothetical protein